MFPKILGRPAPTIRVCRMYPRTSKSAVFEHRAYRLQDTLSRMMTCFPTLMNAVMGRWIRRRIGDTIQKNSSIPAVIVMAMKSLVLQTGTGRMSMITMSQRG